MHVFNLPYILKDNFTGYRILDWQIIFPLISLNISFTSFCFPLFLMRISYFSPGSLFVFVIYQFDYKVSRCDSLCIYPWSSVSIFDLPINVFHKIWEHYSHSSFKYFFVHFSFPFHSGIPMTYILESLTLSH